MSKIAVKVLNRTLGYESEKNDYAYATGALGVGMVAVGVMQILRHNPLSSSLFNSLCGAQPIDGLNSFALLESGHCIGCPIALVGAALMVGAYFLAE